MVALRMSRTTTCVSHKVHQSMAPVNLGSVSLAGGDAHMINNNIVVKTCLICEFVPGTSDDDVSHGRSLVKV